MTCISGLFLMLPLPVPASNILPALTVIFLAAAMLECDGLCVIAFAITLVFFDGIFIGGAAAIHAVREWFSGISPSD
jgi:hypothetical protein